MSAPTNDRREVLAAFEKSLRKRLDDWLESTSEVYAQRDETGEAWRKGLVSYLLRGPGALDAALAAQEGERGGAKVAAEWASNYDFRPHSDRASAEGVRARFGGFIYTRERTSFPDSVTAWRRADRIEAQP